jgi:hypothetical protein
MDRDAPTRVPRHGDERWVHVRPLTRGLEALDAPALLDSASNEQLGFVWQACDAQIVGPTRNV